MILDIKGLNKFYNGIHILKDINLIVDNKMSIGIIGESGCGKSTLLRQLAGIENPDSGEISINGLSPLKDKQAFQKNIGYVFQKHNLFPHLSLRDNIILILKNIKKLDKKTSEEIADKVLKKMFIENEANKLPNQVSGGQVQRASIARALATDPELIFLDEPTAALDPILSNEVFKAVQTLRNDGREFIFITHQMSFLKDFADYIIFMKNGVICEHGPVNCLENPLTNELKQFLSIN